MARPKKEDMVKYSYWEVTPIQKDFLQYLVETGSAKEACKLSGMEYKDFKRTIATSSSSFVTAYKATLEKLDEDFDYSRYRNLGDLHEVRERLLNELAQATDPKEVVAITNAIKGIIEQMNKMVEGNLAATKKINENRSFELKASTTIDLTKSREENGLGNVIEIDE